MSNAILDHYLHDLPVSDDVPNAETREALEEALSGKPLETLDVSSFDAFMASLNAIE